jgi:hypothetical protein
MALRQVLNIDFRTPYQKFNKTQERFAKQTNLFGDPIFTTAESLENSLRNELEYKLNEDPEQAQTILENAINGKKNKPDHQQALRSAGLSDFELATFRTEGQLNRQQTTQNAAILSTAGSFAFNSSLRVLGNAAANAAITSGKVVQFEKQQQTFNNIKRGAGLAGTLAGIGYASLALGPVAVVGASLAFASQIVNLAIENSRISAKQERQDSNAEYYQQAFGTIVRRGNR